jgi:hypothetical protein
MPPLKSLIIYGANYCPYTKALWSELADFRHPFVYVPYTTAQTKEEYWSPLKKALGTNEHIFSFPSIVTVNPDGTARLVDGWEAVRDMSFVRPLMKTAVVGPGEVMKAMATESKPFVYSPCKK